MHKATKYTETTAKAHKALGLLRVADATKNDGVIHIDYANKDPHRMMVKPATLDPYNAIFFDALRCMADGLPYLGPKIIGAIDAAKIDALLAEEITM
jgi:hypothetical protein